MTRQLSFESWLTSPGGNNRLFTWSLPSTTETPAQRIGAGVSLLDSVSAMFDEVAGLQFGHSLA